MRKIIYGINLTLDGCCDHTRGMPDEEVHACYGELLRNSGVLLYGRKTYELMVPHWPNVARDDADVSATTKAFAQAFVSVPRIVVVSKTLESAKSGLPEIIRDDLADAVRTLKVESGKDIMVGGVDVPAQLMALDLIDEIHMVIHPVVVGAGRRLFDELALSEMRQFDLVASRSFRSGGVALHYRRR